MGKPVCTRSGHPARIICFDMKHTSFPLVALVDLGHITHIGCYTTEGLIKKSMPEHPNSLMMADGDETPNSKNIMGETPTDFDTFVHDGAREEGIY